MSSIEAGSTHPWSRSQGLGGAVIAPLMVLAALCVTLFAPQVMNDGDTYWHLAAGEWMLQHRAVPDVDVFSHTRLGAPWQAHEWLSEVLMALALRAAGWSGLLVLFGLAAGAAVAMIAARVGRSLGGIQLLAMLTLAFACLTPSLLLRPHILALPLIVAFAGEMLAARDGDRAPRWWFAVLMMLWANLHGSYVFGFVLIAPFALEALTEAGSATERSRVVRQWGLFGVLCLAATTLTPHGVSGLLFPFQLMTMQVNDGINEWKSSDFTTLTPLEIGLLALLFMSLRHPMRLPILRLLLLLFLIHMALRHGRHSLVLGAVAPLILAAPIGAALGKPAAGRAFGRTALIVMVALGLLTCVARLALPVTRVDGDTSPVTALERTPAEVRSGAVLNEYGFGGYLIFAGVKPYIDGRADMYGDAFVGRYMRMAAPDPALLDETLEASRIGWTIFPPSHPIARLMDRKPGWKRLYADRFAVVHVRAGG